MKKGLIEFHNVSKRFGAKEVIADCSFEIVPGQFTALIGPSGCGKTTIINLIAGYEMPSSGTVRLDGTEIKGPSWERLVVFQESALFPWKSTLANAMFGPLNRNAPRHETESRARTILRKLGLGDFEAKFPNQLSGGMQRRAELARALINSPTVMLLDEPFRGLDAMTRELMQEYLLRLFGEAPVTTVFVTSEIEEAIFLADRILVVSNAPASLKCVVEVDLPRPRDLKILSSPRFGEIHGTILDLLLEEAKKNFAEGMIDAAEIVESYGRAARGQAPADAGAWSPDGPRQSGKKQV
jgi:NitT/TauT family transport system ATP-binding protein